MKDNFDEIIDHTFVQKDLQQDSIPINDIVNNNEADLIEQKSILIAEPTRDGTKIRCRKS